jgi:hypothetical protein
MIPVTMMKPNTTSVPMSSSHQPVNKSELDCFFADITSRIQLAQPDLAHGSSRQPVDQREPAQDQHDLERFFADVHYRVHLAERLQCQLDVRLATRFNVFDLIEPDENKLSDVLAFLLNPKGAHGQSDLFLRMLFKRVGLGSDANLTKDGTVQREAPTHRILQYRRRMDVLVEAGALLAIENKVDSLEQPEQVKDYLAHLDKCTRDSRVQSTLIYLTRDGSSPESLGPAALKQHQASGRLQCWSYQDQLRPWLEDCRRDCEAQRIRDFLSDFIAYIESDLKRESEDNQEKQDNEDNQQ